MTNKPLILIVDDVDFFLEVEKGYLRNSCAEIITARNGKEALDAIRHQKPDLIYMDVNMPIMDGIACCRVIKSDPDMRSIPVIVVYASSKDVDDLQVRESGCDGILHKPVDRNEFLEIGRNFLPQVDRRFKRAPCKMDVDTYHAGTTSRGTGYNISRNGIFVQCADSIPIKARVRMKFLLPDAGSTLIETWGEVAWVNVGPPLGNLNMPHGFGAEFKLLNARHLEMIERYIESCEE